MTNLKSLRNILSENKYEDKTGKRAQDYEGWSWRQDIMKRDPPSESEIDHARSDIHMGQDAWGDSLHRQSKESRDDHLSSLGSSFDKDKHLRPLSVPERRYMKHVYHNHLLPAQHEQGLSQKYGDASSYRNATIKRRAALKEIGSHFGKVWKDLAHQSTITVKTPENHHASNILNDLGISEVSREKRDQRKQGVFPAAFGTKGHTGAGTEFAVDKNTGVKAIHTKQKIKVRMNRHNDALADREAFRKEKLKESLRESRIGDAWKAWKLHTRDERRRGNKLMHPGVQAAAVGYVAANLGAAAHSAMTGDLGTAAQHTMFALGTVSPLLVNHPSEAKRIYKHIRAQPERDQRRKNHEEYKKNQAVFDAERASKQGIRDKINQRRRDRYASKKKPSE